MCSFTGPGELVEEFELHDAGGRFVARFDAALPAVKVALEAHSRAHHLGARLETHDETREAAVTELGWLIEYVSWRQVTQRPDEFHAHLRRVVAQRREQLGLDPPPPDSGPAIARSRHRRHPPFWLRSAHAPAPDAPRTGRRSASSRYSGSVYLT
ncbi:MAG: hypothetical protein R2715_20230 [Ilumatobacteraceae bacterium]